MTDIGKGRWALSGATPADILERLPHMQRVMAVLKGNGATHERIGAVGMVTAEGDWIALGGAVHTARIDAARLAGVTLDTSSEMGGQVYPSLDFTDAEDASVLRIVGMDGADAVVGALDGLTRQAVDPVPRVRPAGDAPKDFSDDPGLVLLERLRDEGTAVTIRAAHPGCEQSWQGRIETVKPGMGFANVMTPDFHLHLRAGTVSGWREDGDRFVALGPDSVETGLVIERVAAE